MALSLGGLLVLSPLASRPATAATRARSHATAAARARPHDAVAPRARPHDAAGSTTTTGASPEPVTLGVDATAGQVMEGFGASGAWWPADLIHFTDDAQHELGELLFSRAGLELSQYRFNIGGGGTGVTDPYKAPPSFLQPSGQYDWDADPAGMTFLHMASDYHVPILVGFVNSAPAVFTTNHQSCGGQLAAGSVAAYAAYLTAVVDHLDQVDHIRLSYISPMNEPDGSQPTCRQEGMAVPVSERAELVDDLAADLAGTAADPGVMADESSLVRQLLDELPQWLPQAGGSVAVVAHHTYDFPGPDLLEQEAQLPVKHWATEICCWNGHRFGWQFDPTMDSGLWLADTIWDDLVQAKDSAFDWWVAVSPNMGCDPTSDPTCSTSVNPAGRNDGLVYIDPNWRTDGNERFYLTKRYWVMAAFSRYVRPGAVLHDVTGLPDGVKGVAFDENGNWVVEVINDTDTDLDGVYLDVPGVNGSDLHVYLTDSLRDLAPVTADRSGALPRVDLAARSLTTVVVGDIDTYTSHGRADHRPSRTS